MQLSLGNSLVSLVHSILVHYDWLGPLSLSLSALLTAVMQAARNRTELNSDSGIGDPGPAPSKHKQTLTQLHPLDSNRRRREIEELKKPILYLFACEPKLNKTNWNIRPKLTNAIKHQPSGRERASKHPKVSIRPGNQATDQQATTARLFKRKSELKLLVHIRTIGHSHPHPNAITV